MEEEKKRIEFERESPGRENPSNRMTLTHIGAACMLWGSLIMLIVCWRLRGRSKRALVPRLWCTSGPGQNAGRRVRPASDSREAMGRPGVYADYGGCPPVSPVLLRACLDDLEVKLARGVLRNPHSIGPTTTCSQGATHISSIDALRERTLQYCKASCREYVCVLTSGATAGCKLVGEAYRPREFAFLVDNHTSVVGISGVCGVKSRSIDVANLFEGESRAKSRLGWFASIKPTRTTHSFGINTKKKMRRLFAYPSESNFTGTRYSLDAIEHWQGRGYRVLLDAAKACSTNPPDLSRHPADFVVLSYYKIFGSPTGLGALLVRRDALVDLERTDSGQEVGYFGGGTVGYVVPERVERGVIRRKGAPHRFEHGTASYLAAPQALVGFDWWQTAGPANEVDERAVGVAMELARRLKLLKHANGQPACVLYGGWAKMLEKGLHTVDVRTVQGPVVTFNVLDRDGRAIGCRDVDRAAGLRGIALRSGSLCNTGGLRIALGRSPDEMVDIVHARTVRWGGDSIESSENPSQESWTCDEGMVLPDGTPSGVVRASFGYDSRLSDAAAIADFVAETFVRAALTRQDTSIAKFAKVEEIADDMMIDTLYVYPIKSCRPQRVTSWAVDATGSLAYDREWKLVDESGAALTLKRCPRLSAVAPTVDLARRVLRIEIVSGTAEADEAGGADRSRCIEVPLDDNDHEPRRCSKYTAWLSKQLGVSCSLVRAQRGNPFSNQGMVLVMHADTIDRLHTSSGLGGDVGVFATRMRPNVILQNAAGHDAHFTDPLFISCASDPSIRAAAIAPCKRCDRVCIDPSTGFQDEHRGAVLQSIVTMAATEGTARSGGMLMRFDPCELKVGLVLNVGLLGTIENSE